MKSAINPVSTENAPSAIGPYSQARKAGSFVFTSGQIPLKPNGELVEGSIKEQTEQVIKNLKAVLEAAGTSLQNAVKVTVYLADMNDFAGMNLVYALYFTGKPARSTVQVAKLPKNAKVEIDVIAKL